MKPLSKWQLETRETARKRRALIVAMHDEHGRSYKDIAKLWGITPQRVQQLYAAGTKD